MFSYTEWVKVIILLDNDSSFTLFSISMSMIIVIANITLFKRKFRTMCKIKTENYA